MIDLLPEARQHDRNVSPMSPNTCHRCPQFIQNQAEWPWSVNASMAETLSAVRFASLGEQVAFGLQLQGASIARRLRIVRLHASNPTLFPRTLQTLILKSTRSKAGVIACSKCCWASSRRLNSTSASAVLLWASANPGTMAIASRK